MRAYSDDLRVSILRAVDAGRSRTAVARAYGVSRSTVLRYLKQRRTSGTITPKPIPRRTPCLRPADYPALVAQLAAAPDATLNEHTRRWPHSKLSTAPSCWGSERLLVPHHPLTDLCTGT